MEMVLVLQDACQTKLAECNADRSVCTGKRELAQLGQVTVCLLLASTSCIEAEVSDFQMQFLGCFWVQRLPS